MSVLLLVYEATWRGWGGIILVSIILGVGNLEEGGGGAAWGGLGGRELSLSVHYLLVQLRNKLG